MTAILKPAAFLREYCSGQKAIEVPSGISIAAALEYVGIPVNLVALALVDKSATSKDTILEDGQVVEVLGIVGGG